MLSKGIVDQALLNEFLRLDRQTGREQGLYHFMNMAWHLVEPGTPFVKGRTLELLCEHLDAVRTGQIRRLVINIPPGFTKSLSVSVFFPTHCWVNDPTTKFIRASFDAQLTLRDARRCLLILQSEWYQKRFGDICPMPTDVAAGMFGNLVGGWQFSTSLEGKMTGRHCNIAIIDDPHKPQEVSKTTLEGASRWWHETLPSRFSDHKNKRIVLMMQRLHEDDLSGHALREGGWEVLRLPMRFEASAKCVTSVGTDWRNTDGELLDPVRFPEEVVSSLERDMGSRVAAAQLQQRPAPAEGAIFLRKWIQYYKELPGKVDTWVQSWDCAFRDTDGSDYVCGQVWAVSGASYYLVDQIHARLDFPSTCQAIAEMSRRYPKTITKLIEAKANGDAVIATLGKSLSGLVAVTPEGGKESRANAIAPLFEAGNVYLPDPAIAPWIDAYVHELTTFPFASHDDRVDATSQALLYLHQKKSDYGAALANWGKVLGW